MSITYSHWRHVVVVSYGPAPPLRAAAWLRHRTEYCAFLLQRHEPHGVPSPCRHNCMVCYCLSNSYAIISDITDVSTISQFQDQQKPHLLISRRAVRRWHYRPRIKSGWKLPCWQWKLNPQPSVQLRPMMIKTSTSTEMATTLISHDLDPSRTITLHN